MGRGAIRVGIGGWTYEPWRGTFYPEGLRQADELAHAAARLGTIEINGTFYGRQKRESFAKWRDAAAPGFVFTVKANRACVNRKRLDEGAESVARFFEQGVTELGDKLGPILWQLAATKRFDAREIAGFLALLPREHDGMGLRHAMEPRHESFDTPEFHALAREHGVAVVTADSAKYPAFGEATADFTYARLQSAREDEPAGYPAGELDAWAGRARDWAAKGDVFVFFINGAKVRAPAAAEALIARLEAG
ncbi:MAG TPA: DUF72 domain-containing protein [Novosphingobium sp.]|nr:DUF72 domain-containing protein [Novosphingobium sp.]